MNNIFKEVYLNISINKNNLTKNEQAYINVDLINKSDYILENTLIKIDLNTNIFSVLDKKYLNCINNFGNIGDIERNSINNFSFPIKVENTSLNTTTNIFANINFHIIKNNNINDFNIFSNDIEINFDDIGVKKELVSYNSYVGDIINTKPFAQNKENTDTQNLKTIAKSNKLDFKVDKPSLFAVQKFSSNVFLLNEKYTYILNLNNNGNCDLFDVLININLPKNLKYIKNSTIINNKNVDFNDLKNIKIKKIETNESLNICIDFLVEKTSDSEFVLINTDIDANYKDLDKFITKSFKTSKQQIKIESADLQIAKFVSHEYLQKGDILTVQNILNNTGSIDLKNVTLTDNKIDNLNFVYGSVFIDGENLKSLNPLEGIVIDLKSSKNILIKYDYKYSPKLYSSTINHYSTINYSYEIKDEKIKTNSIKSEVIKIEAGSLTFKKFKFENKYNLSEFESDIYEIIGISTDGFIESIYESKKSLSDKNSKELIIKGSLVDRVEYLTKKDKDSIYLFERTNPFSVLINISDDYCNKNINFKVKCDDVFYRINNEKSIFVSSLISIKGVL